MDNRPVAPSAEQRLLNLGSDYFHPGPTMRADEGNDLFHSTQVRIRRPAMRTPHLRTYPGCNEDLAPRPVPDLHWKFLGIGRIRIEMSDGLLQPRKDVGHQGHIGFGYEAVQAIAEPDLNPAVP